MILEPGPSYARAVAFDASGLRVHRIPQHPRSPFAFTRCCPEHRPPKSGCSLNDLLVALDDVPMRAHVPGIVQEALTRDGRDSSC